MILAQAETFVFELFKDKLSNLFTYHNFYHTLGVVSGCQILLKHHVLDDQAKQNLLLAAWFHDTGYVENSHDHEEKSVEIAHSFLKNHVSENDFHQIKRLILSTQFNHVPTQLDEMILKDADFCHFAEDLFFEKSEWLRKEWKFTLDKNYSDLEWLQETEKIMTQCHRFYTDFAKLQWQPEKVKNLVKIQNQLQKLNDLNLENAVKKVKIPKADRPDRGIETMFRIALDNHIKLSDIADSKANILLSVNAIIISIALSTLVPKLDSPSNAHLILPTFFLIVISVVSIVFAIFSTRPKITSGIFTRKDIEDQKANLLFFGNFYKMPLEDYLWGVNKVMEDRTFLYNSLIKDLYFLGLVLSVKYRWLRITYTFFMFGLILSVMLFTWAFVYK